MKTIFSWLIVFILGLALTTLALLNLGEVTLRWGLWEIKTSATLILAVFIVFIVAFYAVLKLWFWIFSLPKKIRQIREIKRFHKAQTSLTQGLIAQEEADWAQAEKQLIRTAKLSDNGLMHYLAAARMAQMQAAIKRRDKYLQLARKNYPEQSVLIGLVEARFYVQTNPDLAEKILEDLYNQNSSHKSVINEYLKLLRSQKNVKQLENIQPAIKKYSGLTRQELKHLDIEITTLNLEKAQKSEEIQEIWDSLTSEQKLNPQIVAAYIKALENKTHNNDLAGIIETALKKTWDENLVYLYGKLEQLAAYDKLKLAQSWLKDYPNSAIVLLTCGRLACQSKLWGQAYSYLKSSIAQSPQLETYQALAQCYEKEGAENQASLVYKQALNQLTEKSN